MANPTPGGNALTRLIQHEAFAGVLMILAAVLALPLSGDDFWLNRVAKYMCFGMLGAAGGYVWRAILLTIAAMVAFGEWFSDWARRRLR